MPNIQKGDIKPNYSLEYIGIQSFKITLYGNLVLNCASEPQVCAHTLLWAFLNIFKMWKKKMHCLDSIYPKGK